VLAKEVLRTDLYERSMGREYVYVKFRCQRCKRMGEAFVAENRWDWSMLEPAHNEMSDAERDRFLDAEAISSEEVLDFHRQLADLKSLPELVEEAARQQAQEALTQQTTLKSGESIQNPGATVSPDAANSELITDSKQTTERGELGTNDIAVGDEIIEGNVITGEIDAGRAENTVESAAELKQLDKPENADSAASSTDEASPS
jgi:hypothetical protein